MGLPRMWRCPKPSVSSIEHHGPIQCLLQEKHLQMWLGISWFSFTHVNDSFAGLIVPFQDADTAEVSPSHYSMSQYTLASIPPTAYVVGSLLIFSLCSHSFGLWARYDFYLTDHRIKLDSIATPSPIYSTSTQFPATPPLEGQLNGREQIAKLTIDDDERI